MVFFLLGAWPVVGFLGLDVVLVYWAFRANFRSAAAFEEVIVTPSRLRVRRVGHRGQVSEWTLNPCWTQLVRDAHEEFGLLHLYPSRAAASCRWRVSCRRPSGKASRWRFRRRWARPNAARLPADRRLVPGTGWVCRRQSGLDGEQ